MTATKVEHGRAIANAERFLDLAEGGTPGPGQYQAEASFHRHQAKQAIAWLDTKKVDTTELKRRLKRIPVRQDSPANTANTHDPDAVG